MPLDINNELQITHNFNVLAEKVGLYNAIWRPNEIANALAPIKNYESEQEYPEVRAKEILPILKDGFEFVAKRPEFCVKFLPKDKTLEDFAIFVSDYINYCENNLNQTIKTNII